MKRVEGLRVFVTTCNAYLWTLEAFAHQFNKYWSDEQPVVVGCYAPPSNFGIKLPDNFTVHQIQTRDVPRHRVGDGWQKFFRQMPDKFFVWMLEDFWLKDKVDVEGIAILYEFMQAHHDILRVDLTTDRISTAKNAGKLEHLDLIESLKTSRYHWSHQGAIWNKKLMLPYMRPGDGTAIEIYCSQRLRRDPNSPRVFGTKNCPLPYAHMLRKGNPDKKTIWTNDGRLPLKAEDTQELKELGYI